MIRVLLANLGFLAAILLSGVGIARLIAPRLGKLELAAVGFPLGAGLLAGVTFLLALAGLPVSRLIVFAVLAALLIVALLGMLIGANRAIFRRTDHRPDALEGGAPIAWLAACVSITLAIAVLSTIRAHSTWDAMAIWVVKGYAIAEHGSLLAAGEWGSHGLSYPLQLPLLIGFFRILDGDILPGSKLIFPAYYFSLLMCVYLLLSRYSNSRVLPALGSLFLGSIPFVLEHAMTGYANLALATLVVLGSYFLTVGQPSDDKRVLVLSGVLYGLAIWMRPEAIYLVPLLVLTLWILRKDDKTPLLSFLHLVIPIVLIGGGWVIFRLQFSSGSLLRPVFQEAIGPLSRGDIHLGAAYFIVRYMGGRLLEPGTWGLALPLLVIAPILAWRRGVPFRRMVGSPLLVSAFAWGLPVIGFYYLLSYDSRPLIYWLSTGLERQLLPAALLAVLWGFSLVSWEPAGSDQ